MMLIAAICLVYLLLPLAHASCPAVVRQYVVKGSDIVDTELLSFAAVISDATGTCTATVLTSRHLLTAAHCDYAPGANVHAGVLSVRSPAIHWVKKFIKHPGYIKKQIVHDIAVVEIDPPLKSFKPSRLHNGIIPKPGSFVRACGYGVNTADYKTTNNDGRGTLRRVDLPVVSITKCRSDLQNKNVAIPLGFTAKNYICAGYTAAGNCGGDTCVGDSGGPIVLKSSVDGGYVQVGVTSAGLGCGNMNIPGLYTNVATHVSWVSKTTGGQAVVVNAFSHKGEKAAPSKPSSSDDSSRKPSETSKTTPSSRPTTQDTGSSKPPADSDSGDNSRPSASPPPRPAVGSPKPQPGSSSIPSGSDNPSGNQGASTPRPSAPQSENPSKVPSKPVKEPSRTGKPGSNSSATPAPDMSSTKEEKPKASETPSENQDSNNSGLSRGAIAAIASVFSIVGVVAIGVGVFFAYKALRASQAGSAAGGNTAIPGSVEPMGGELESGGNATAAVEAVAQGDAAA